MFSDAYPPILFAEETLGTLDGRARFIAYTELAYGLPGSLPLWQRQLEDPRQRPSVPMLAWPNWRYVLGVPREQRPAALGECLLIGGRLCHHRADEALADLVSAQGCYRAARTIGLSGTALHRRLAARRRPHLVR